MTMPQLLVVDLADMAAIQRRSDMIGGMVVLIVLALLAVVLAKAFAIAFGVAPVGSALAISFPFSKAAFALPLLGEIDWA